VKTYEAMFLLDPSLSGDFAAAEAEVRRLLDRAEAKVLGIRNWEERKLAYAIGPFKRGLYVLAYFEAAPEKISGIERDVQLGEKTIRVLILRRERMTPERLEKAMTAPLPPKTPVRASDEWSSGPSGGGGGGRGRSDAPRAASVAEPEAPAATEVEEPGSGRESEE
jgi:small subunit ribosomal protein S6